MSLLLEFLYQKKIYHKPFFCLRGQVSKTNIEGRQPDSSETERGGRSGKGQFASPIPMVRSCNRCNLPPVANSVNHVGSIVRNQKSAIGHNLDIDNGILSQRCHSFWDLPSLLGVDVCEGPIKGRFSLSKLVLTIMRP